MSKFLHQLKIRTILIKELECFGFGVGEAEFSKKGSIIKSMFFFWRSYSINSIKLNQLFFAYKYRYVNELYSG